MPAVLVVANQTITNDDLLAALTTRAAEDQCTFTLLVPATAAADITMSMLSAAVNIPTARGSAVDEYELARQRLSSGLQIFRKHGIHVDGEVGDADPMTAIREVMADRRFDEVIVSTLPSTVSRWLRQDLPHKIERKYHLPVKVVTAAS